jgi:general secretion pathway protein C
MDTYQSIITRDLFKTREDAKPEKAATDIELEKLQKTSLKLTLFGTITGRSEDEYAVIEDSQKLKQGLYKKGDAIQDAEIKMILRKKVVLNVNGKDEILLMEEDKSPQKGTGPALESPENSEMEEPSLEESTEEQVVETGENINIERETIDSSLKNINQLMSQVKIRPHFKDGKPNGLLLSHVQENSIFKDMGLQNGDIVKGVNGKEIQSVDDALKFYENLKSSSSVELQVERGGDLLSINYQIE